MDLRINLATRHYFDMRKVDVVLSCAVLLIVVYLAYIVIIVATRAGEIQRLEHEVAKLDKRYGRNLPNVTEGEYKVLLGKMASANALIDKKILNWGGLLDRLESAVPPGVALTSVEPNPKSNELLLTGYARDFGKLKQLVEYLENSKDFVDVYLLTHMETVIETQKVVTFKLSCKADLKKL